MVLSAESQPLAILENMFVLGNRYLNNFSQLHGYFIVAPPPPFCEGRGGTGSGFLNSMKSGGELKFFKIKGGEKEGERGIFEIFIGGGGGGWR